MKHSLTTNQMLKPDASVANNLELFDNNNETGYPVCSPKTTDLSRVGLNQFSNHHDVVAMGSSLECVDRDVMLMAAAAVPEVARHFMVGVPSNESLSTSSPAASRRSPSDARTSTPISTEPETKPMTAEEGSHVPAPQHGAGSDDTGEHHCLLWACKTCKKKTTAAVDRRKVGLLTLLLICIGTFDQV